jgi:myo-inositol-1(or 4)-monophosphatase
MDLKEELELGKHLLEVAGKEIMSRFQSDIQVEMKEDQTPVTAADKRAEEVMRRIIEKQTPSYGIIGEEFGGDPGDAARQWVIDPIDGTKSFIRGVPLFGSLLALLEKGEPVMGLISLPALKSTMWAVKGQGCFVDDSRCGVSEVDELSQATLLDGSITTMENSGYGKPWRNLRSRAFLHRGWGDCYGYYLVASGRAEVMVDPVAQIWDLAPMAVIISEAGGTFTSVKGGGFIKDQSGIASNGILHDDILEAFRPYVQ